MAFVIYILILGLAILGLCDVIHTLRLFLFAGRKKQGTNVLFCFLCDSKAELQLKFVAEQYRWHGRGLADKVIAINCLSDADSLNACLKTANDNDIEIIEYDKISET